MRAWIAVFPLLLACSSSDPMNGSPMDPGQMMTPPGSSNNPPSKPMLGPAQPAGGVLLEADGTIVPFGGVMLDTTNAPSWKGMDEARALDVLIDGSGGWVLDKSGAIHAFGKAPAIDSKYAGDARAFVVLADFESGYVMDSDGGLHPFGKAPMIAGPAMVAKGLARGFDVHLSNGTVDGGWVLDGFGHVTKFGAATDIGTPPVYDGYDLWAQLHVVAGGAYVIGRWGIIEPVGKPQGVPLMGLPDTKDQDIVRDIVPISVMGAFDPARALICPTDGTYCGSNGMPGSSAVLYSCAMPGISPAVTVCGKGCNAQPPGTPDYCNGVLLCSHLQWWNSALTYGPYMSYGWWDTDLNVTHDTPVQLRHDSKLYKYGVYGWGYMPEFIDQVTNEKFRFLHLRPQHQLATNVGQVYAAGTIVGYSGGDTADTGYPTYSTGQHLCVQTLDAYRTCFPTGNDPCQ
jgi:hypothetical protein